MFQTLKQAGTVTEFDILYNRKGSCQVRNPSLRFGAGKGGDKGGIAHALYRLGGIACDQGDFRAAGALYQESVALYRETGHSFLIHVLGASDTWS